MEDITGQEWPPQQEAMPKEAGDKEPETEEVMKPFYEEPVDIQGLMEWRRTDHGTIQLMGSSWPEDGPEWVWVRARTSIDMDSGVMLDDRAPMVGKGIDQIHKLLGKETNLKTTLLRAADRKRCQWQLRRCCC